MGSSDPGDTLGEARAYVARTSLDAMSRNGQIIVDSDAVRVPRHRVKTPRRKVALFPRQIVPWNSPKPPDRAEEAKGLGCRTHASGRTSSSTPTRGARWTAYILFSQVVVGLAALPEPMADCRMSQTLKVSPAEPEGVSLCRLTVVEFSCFDDLDSLTRRNHHHAEFTDDFDTTCIDLPISPALVPIKQTRKLGHSVRRFSDSSALLFHLRLHTSLCAFFRHSPIDRRSLFASYLIVRKRSIWHL